MNCCTYVVPVEIKKGFRSAETLTGLMSGWQDSNLRHPVPKTGALTGLRYTPNKILIRYLSGYTFFKSECECKSKSLNTSLFYLIKPKIHTQTILRRGGDSNSRYALTAYDGLANRSFRPLRHLSKS